jgi:NAD(P)-dependent dehydrogenase (short-subunit alcohol dehydrogenase family)
MIDLGLDGRRALVTGAGAGIGRAIAIWLARAGCDLMLADKDPTGLEATRAAIDTHGRQADSCAIDLREEGAADRLVTAAVHALGGLEVAVNNVGMLGGRMPAPFLEQDDAYVHDVVAQNLLLTAACCRAEARAMVASDTAGVILNVSSGETTRPALDLAAYGAAKAGVNHLSQTLAAELGPHGIRVNAIAPGTTLTTEVRAALSDEYVDALTASIPLQRMNEPDDLARLVVALASDLGRGVTGQLVLADNGAHLSRQRPARRTGRQASG